MKTKLASRRTNRLTVAQLLAENVDDEATRTPEDDSEVLPTVNAKEASLALITIKTYIQQQDATDMSSELSMIRKVLDYVEERRINDMQQSSIFTFLDRQ